MAVQQRCGNDTQIGLGKIKTLTQQDIYDYISVGKRTNHNDQGDFMDGSGLVDSSQRKAPSAWARGISERIAFDHSTFSRDNIDVVALQFDSIREEAVSELDEELQGLRRWKKRWADSSEYCESEVEELKKRLKFAQEIATFRGDLLNNHEKILVFIHYVAKDSSFGSRGDDVREILRATRTRTMITDHDIAPIPPAHVNDE